jgi:hypothetical protein
MSLFSHGQPVKIESRRGEAFNSGDIQSWESPAPNESSILNEYRKWKLLGGS